MNVARSNPSSSVPSSTPSQATPASAPSAPTSAPSSPNPAPPTPTVDSQRYALLPAGPSTEAFRDLKASIDQLRVVVRRWSTRTKSLKEPVKGALADVIALEDQLGALWTHLDRVLQGLPPVVRGERTAWRRPRYPFPDLTGELPRSDRDSLRAELED